MTHVSMPVPGSLAEVDCAAAMSRGVVTAPATASPRRVASIMAAHDVHAVAVTDIGPPRFHTDLDVIAALLQGHLTVHRSRTGLPEVAPDDPLTAAVDEMIARTTSHVLVHGPRGALPIGVVSSFDVAAVIAGRDPRIAPMARPSAARPALSEGRLDRLTVAEVMHPGIIGVGPAATLRNVAAVLCEWRVHAVTVAGPAPGGESGRLVWATATDLDVVRAVGAGADADATIAATLAATEPLVVDVGTPLDDAARRLVEHDVGHAVVVEGDAVVGVLSTLDVLHVLAVTA